MSVRMALVLIFHLCCFQLFAQEGAGLNDLVAASDALGKTAWDLVIRYDTRDQELLERGEGIAESDYVAAENLVALAHIHAADAGYVASWCKNALAQYDAIRSEAITGVKAGAVRIDEPADGPPFNPGASTMGAGAGSPRDPYRWLNDLHRATKRPFADANEKTIALFCVLRTGQSLMRTGPYSGWTDTPFAGFTEEHVAVLVWRLLAAERTEDLDDIILKILLTKKQLIPDARGWCLDYVLERKLAAAVPIMVSMWPAWRKAERTDWRPHIGKVLGSIGGEKGFTALHDWIHSEDLKTRRAALDGLALIGSPEALALIQEAAENDEADWVRKWARKLLLRAQAKQ